MKPCAVTGELPYTGIADCATKIIKNEGALTFWRGFGAFYMRSAPHAMIVLLSRDKITSIYRDITGLNDI